MNMSTELGISPVLLQAISEKLSPKDRHSLSKKMDPAFIKQEMMDNSDECSQEMIGDQCSVISQDVGQILPDIVNSVQQRISLDGSQRGITADDIRQIINLKLAQQAQQRIAQNSDRQNNSFVVSPEPANDQSTMMNFLSNVAVTQMKSTQENSNASSTVVTDNSDLRTFNPEPNMHSPPNSNQIFVCYNNQNNSTTVPSPSNDIVVSDAGSAVNVVIDQTGQRYLMQDAESNSDHPKINENLIKQARYNEKGELVISDMAVSSPEKPEGIDLSVSSISSVVTDPCPICGDQVSGNWVN